jgi:Zn-dependent oligopeptidase
LHASWQPVELIEVPSTLLEVFVMDSSCLQLLGVHEDTGEALPQGLADRLAAFMRGAHYHPAGYQSVVSVCQ